MMTMFQAQKKHPVAIQEKLVAHRGANNHAPENTDKKFPENSLFSLEEAFSLGVPVELDVIRLKCGTFIVFHDDTLERLGRFNPELVTTLTESRFYEINKRRLTELTYDEVSQVDVGIYVSQEFQKTRIPTLVEFLSTLHQSERKLFIELKSDDPSIAKPLSECVEACKSEFDIQDHQLIFISFDFHLIAALKKRLPMHQHFLLTTAGYDEKTAIFESIKDLKFYGLYHRIKSAQDLERCIALAKMGNLDGLDVEYDKHITSVFVKKVHEAHLKVAVWNYTMDDTLPCLKHLLRCQVDFINTNQPGHFIAYFSRNDATDTCEYSC